MILSIVMLCRVCYGMSCHNILYRIITCHQNLLLNNSCSQTAHHENRMSVLTNYITAFKSFKSNVSIFREKVMCKKKRAHEKELSMKR